MGGGKSPGVRVQTDSVRGLGADLVTRVGPILERSSHSLGDARAVVHSNFTAVVPSLAIAYAAAVEYMDPELRGKRAHLDDLRVKLVAVADNWEAADQASTVQLRGDGNGVTSV